MAITVSELLNGVASRLVYEGSICDRHPCWNDGKCQLNGTSNFFCDCPPAFVGVKCEYRIFDLCKISKCQNFGLCDFGNFKVNCSLLRQKDFLSSCLSSQCLNGGTCLNSTGLHRCQCTSLFHGPFCQFDNSETSYEWTILEVSIFFFVIFMVAFAVMIICCASSNHMGFYISVPNKHYNRWEDEDDMFDDIHSDNGEQLMAMSDIRKHFEKQSPGVTRGLVVSRTRETVLEDLDDSAILQL